MSSNKVLITVLWNTIYVNKNINGVISCSEAKLDMLFSSMLLACSDIELRVFNYGEWYSMNSSQQIQIYNFFEENPEWSELLPIEIREKLEDWDWYRISYIF